MPALVAGIHVLLPYQEGVDGRDISGSRLRCRSPLPGHDAGGVGGTSPRFRGSEEPEAWEPVPPEE
jgi:hypothetical protein